MRYLLFVCLFLVSCQKSSDSQKLLFNQLKDAKNVYKDLMFRDAYNSTKMKRDKDNNDRIVEIEMLLENYYKVETRIQNSNVNNLETLINEENKKIKPYVGKISRLRLLNMNDVILLEKSERITFVDFYFAKVYYQIISNFAPTFCVYSNFS